MKRKAVVVIKGEEVEIETEGYYYCGRCGRPLTSEKSQLKGYGPECLRFPFKGGYKNYPKIVLDINPVGGVEC